MAHAAYSDLVKRFDERTIADLASDSDAPEADLANSAVVTAALSSASGRINSAVMQSGLYTAAELTALTGDDLAFLVDLTCELSMAWLVRRRPSPDNAEWSKSLFERTEETLNKIRQGHNLFNVEVKKTAGQPETDGPSAVDYSNLNLIPDRTHNFYPSRGSRLPIGR